MTREKQDNVRSNWIERWKRGILMIIKDNEQAMGICHTSCMHACITAQYTAAHHNKRN